MQEHSPGDSTAPDCQRHVLRVLVTGASRGIGLEIARSFSAGGHRVAMTARSADPLRARARELGATALRADLRRATDVERLAVDTVATLGGVDVLVNNAGIAPTGPAIEASSSMWDEVLAVNLRAPAILSARLGDYMAQHDGGRVVQVASVAGLHPFEGHFAYCASKAGLLMASRVLARELGPSGVTVNSVCPTVVATDMGLRVWSEPASRNAMLARIPVGRFATPSDIAGAVRFLCSEDAAMLNGVELVVDGGFLAT